MSSVTSCYSFSSTASSADSYVNLDLTPGTCSEFNGPIIGFLADNDCKSLTFCDELSEGIYAELCDNVQNATLSKNALEFRCKVFSSIFGTEVEDLKPKRGRRVKDVSAIEEEDQEVHMRGSDDEEGTRRPVLKTASDNYAEEPKVRKKIGVAPSRTLPGLTKAVARPKAGDSVQKRRTTGRGQNPKRSYNWKHPERRNKTKFYEERARGASVTTDEYLTANNIKVEGSATNNFERTNNNGELSDEEKEMKNNDSNESGDDIHNEDELDEEAQDDLFVNQARVKINPPTMTERRVAMLASQYFDDLSKLADSEPVNHASIAVKCALQKVKAGISSQLSAAEQVELHLAVERYEATF